MKTDRVDLFIGQWKRERPDLDPSPLGVVSRLLMLYRHLEQNADDALAEHGLALWQFDVLAALRRSGAPYTLTPTAISRLVTLSSGAMTNRIDRLESMGLVARHDDPGDRRGVLIALTPKGRRLVDESVATRLNEARAVLAPLNSEEERTLATLLKRLLVSLNDEDAEVRPSKRASKVNPGKQRRTLRSHSAHSRTHSPPSPSCPRPRA